MEKSEIRKDYFQEKYVIVAPKRAKRPHKVLIKEEDQVTLCHFCPDQIEKESIISKTSSHENGWDVLVINNKFPALIEDNPRAFGKQEVVIETPEHNKEIHELSIEHIEKIIDTYIDRFDTLSKIKGVRYVIVFKNEGGKAGASIAHAHSQVVALPLLPPDIKEEYQSYGNYQVENGTCPYCDVIKKETGKSRVIWENEHFFVVSPFASQFPYGAWFLPKRHFKTMNEMTVGEKKSLATALKVLLAKLDQIDTAYNYFFHNSANGEDYHMHLKLEPRPNIWAGLELGTGVVINPVPPEDAAKFYRQ
ncbi:MAG: galactose-1-phosphate uridylyltransferase [Patescibacteria group bacterium]|jgi:UDPglucose--hexose-1-phosphate uridylyltransferase|nr:galactose-1-phosphate uridylyltransferase [Patescibacteria group bacterium]